ncbi:hypothetical protein CDCA_CDCA17G4305 [Cyanidium caldarium]|uniref:Myb-like domain-containing protein n=1 Tax=Cyanidium caldarium TaxID=2771 RepID=A0AAV9J113_CYACA|nr:hypothetical protein CDCA_CDCA17G4305 [Cyanidium caldarium]
MAAAEGHRLRSGRVTQSIAPPPQAIQKRRRTGAAPPPKPTTARAAAEKHHPTTPHRGTVHAPRLRVDEYGNVVVDEASLVVPVSASPAAATRDAAHPAAVPAAPVTAGSFIKRSSCERWPPTETDLFYRGLRAFGQNYTMIERLFANRTRKQIKNKFKKEERLYPQRIEEALAVHAAAPRMRARASGTAEADAPAQRRQQRHWVFGEFDRDYIEAIFGTADTAPPPHLPR